MGVACGAICMNMSLLEPQVWCRRASCFSRQQPYSKQIQIVIGAESADLGTFCLWPFNVLNLGAANLKLAADWSVLCSSLCMLLLAEVLKTELKRLGSSPLLVLIRPCDN